MNFTILAFTWCYRYIQIWDKYYYAIELGFDVKAKEFGITVDTSKGDVSKLSSITILKSTDQGTTWSKLTSFNKRQETISATNDTIEAARYAILVEGGNTTRLNIFSIYAKAE